jgi:F420-0:gamma-glutamyl ligase
MQLTVSLVASRNGPPCVIVRGLDAKTAPTAKAEALLRMRKLAADMLATIDGKEGQP